MCGRFTLTTSYDALVDEFGYLEIPFNYHARFNIAPGQHVLALVSAQGKLRAGELRWGLVPYWAKDPSVAFKTINARAETLTTKPAFREPFQRRRCLVVADGYYEWQKVGAAKVPVRIHFPSGRPFAFAALWDRWRDAHGEALHTCTIVTTTPAEGLGHIHDRMPVILDAAARERWLDPAAGTDELLSLLTPYSGDEPLAFYSVSRLVNSADNDAPECIEPVPI